MTISAELAQYVRAITGLNIDTLSRKGVSYAIEERLRTLQLANEAAYLHVLRQSADERRWLSEAVVVPETWFFRDTTPFLVAVRHLLSLTPRPQPLRVLSLPCSTGEEAYSLAMALAAQGLTSTNCCIDAIDLSEVNVSAARAARYRPLSFREKDPQWRPLVDKYTVLDEELRTIVPTIRQMVRPASGNLLESATWGDGNTYHVIFCRNLFIYFDAEVRQRGLGVLQARLHRQGLLFVGHVEAGPVTAAGWTQADPDYPFAFLPPDTPAARAVPLAATTSLPEKPAMAALPRATSTPVPKPASVGQRPILPSPVAASSPSPALGSPGPEAIAVLRQLKAQADAGQLEGVGEKCRQWLDRWPAHADAWCLLGLICQCEGDIELAERYYQRAAYLEPRHEEALIHLSLLASQQNNAALAEAYRRRAMGGRS